MWRIWKYRLILGNHNVFNMPRGAKVLDAQMKDGRIHLWALVDPDAMEERREFAVYGTGHPIDVHPGQYVATVHDSAFVWHVFDHGPVADRSAA